MFADLLSPEEDPALPDQSGESSFFLQSARVPSGRGSAARDAFSISAGDIATPQYRGGHRGARISRYPISADLCSVELLSVL